MAWDRTKPGSGDNLESAPVRGNFQAVDKALWGKNLLANSEANIWPNGSDSGANQPAAHWTKIGSAIIECVTGGKRTKFSQKVTYSGSGTDGLRQSMLPSHDGSFDGVEVSACAWVKATSTGVTIGIEDGGAAGNTDSSAHSGGGDWELLTLTHTIQADSTKLDFICEITSTGNFQLNQPTVVFGAIPHQETVPSEIIEGTIQWPVSGTFSTGVISAARFTPWKPFFVVEVAVGMDTPPQQQAVLVNSQKFDGSSWQNMFNTGTGQAVEVGTGNYFGSRVPNATSTLDSTGAGDVSMWARSFNGLGGSSGDVGATGLAGRKVRASVEQADATATATGADALAADGEVIAHAFQYKRPLAAYLRAQD